MTAMRLTRETVGICVHADIVKKSSDAYGEAMYLAETHLKSSDPVRLGVALNFSVFMYEIENKPDMACKIAKTVSN